MNFEEMYDDEPICPDLDGDGHEIKTTATLKIGGASMSKVATEVKPIADRAIKENDYTVIVVSAFKDVTQKSLDLIDAVRDLFLNSYEGGLLEYPKELEVLMNELSNHILAVLAENFESNVDVYSRLYEEFMDGIAKIKDFLHTILNLAGHIPVDSLETLLDDAKNKLLAFGERLSALALEKIIEGTELLDLTAIIEKGKGMQIDEIRERVGIAAMEIVVRGGIPIIPGYLGHGTEEILGRGYTEATAACVATYLAENLNSDGRNIMDVWKDVVLSTGDPRRLKGREMPIEKMSGAELVEAVGAGRLKALNEEALRMLLPYNVLLRLRNTARPDDMGAVISRRRCEETDVSVAQSINVKDCVYMVRIKSNKMISNQGETSKGFMRRIGQIAEQLGISIDIISTAANTIAFTFDGNINGNSCVPDNIGELLLEAFNNEPDIDSADMVDRPLSSIVIVGDQFKRDEFKGVIAVAEAILRVKLGIDIKLRSQASPEAMSFVVPTESADLALRMLHFIFVEETKVQFFERRRKMMEAGFGDIEVEGDSIVIKPEESSKNPLGGNFVW